MPVRRTLSGPGHIFPLVAREGGVLMRSGHTEAAVDLCKLANLPPVGVISELMNEDGTVTRGDQVIEFAKKHNLKKVSVADLIAYRQRQESLVERIESQRSANTGRQGHCPYLPHPLGSDAPSGRGLR